MSNRAEVLEVLNSEWDSLIGLSNQLTPEQWATPALCPGWTVHGVYVHLTAVEEALSKWWPSSADDPPPFEKIVSGYTELNALSPDELRARFECRSRDAPRRTFRTGRRRVVNPMPDSSGARNLCQFYGDSSF